MTRYRYRAVDDAGNPVEDTMEETSAHRVTQKLRERGLTVNSVEKLGQERGLLRVSKRLKWEELELLAEQLASVARGGLPLAPALRALAADLRNPRLKPVLDRLSDDLDRGVTLEEAIQKQQASFPPLFSSVIRAGEVTGNLAGVLQILTKYTSRMVGIKTNLQLALAYPATVIVAALCVVGFLMVKVVPVFAEIFQEFGGQLPAPTRLCIEISDLVRYNWPELCIGAAGVVIAVIAGHRLLLRTQGWRCWADTVRLHLPVTGHLYYLMCLARFSRTLGMLLVSRVPVLESLELAAAASGSAQLERAVDDANLQVAGGQRISDALAGTGFFGHNFCWLLGTSEDRGEAEVALDSLADTFEREATARDKLVGIMTAPALIFVVGLMILFVVVSLYLPIFTLGDVISGC